MEYTKLKCINQYKSESINPAKTPDTIFEMYSVPVYETGHPEYLRGDEIASNKAVVQKDDILLCKINPRINRVWVVSNESDKQNIASSEWIVIRNSEYNPEFLAWYFRTPKFQKLMTSEVTGIGGSLTRAQPKCVAEYPVPVMDRKKQDEIVNVLNKCKFVVDSRQKELLELDDLIKARFVEMFGDVQHEEKYKGIQLRELCTTMSGGTPSTKFPEYYEGDIPWISTVSLGPNYIDGTTAKGYITQEAVDNSATKLIPAGNILFGTRVGVGKSSLNNVDICTNQDIVAIVGIDESKFNRLFIKHVLDAYQPYYDSIKKGATILGITGDDLKDTLIPNVPIEIQIEFEKFVNQVDKSKLLVQKSLDETQVLFNSLMQKYFG